MVRVWGGPRRLKRDAMATIEKYDWPGNVRELKNALERSLVLSRATEIGVEDIARRGGARRDDLAEASRRRSMTTVSANGGIFARPSENRSAY